MLDKIEDLSFQCGMNQRYYQIQASNAWWWATAIALAVAIIALASTLLTVASYYRPDDPDKLPVIGLRRYFTLGRISLVVSVMSLIAATILNVAPVTSEGQYYSDLFRRWSDLRQDVDGLKEEADSGSPEEYIAKRYRDLLIKKNAISAHERAPDTALVERCWEDENESRTSFRTTDPNEKQKHSVRDKHASR